jgi:hypothetical protein
MELKLEKINTIANFIGQHAQIVEINVAYLFYREKVVAQFIVDYVIRNINTNDNS